MTFNSRKALEDWGVDLLRGYGFLVGRMTDKRRTPPGMRGWPDLLAIKSNHLWLIEVKFGSDTLKPDQIIFEQALEQHTGSHIHYRVASSEDDFLEILQESIYERS